jgi:hypothetical protein
MWMSGIGASSNFALILNSGTCSADQSPLPDCPQIEEDPFECRVTAVLVHRAPEVMLDAVDPDEYLIQVPVQAKGWPLSAQPCSIKSAELLAPHPDRLVRHLNASLGHHLLDIAVAKGEAEVQPHAVLYHFDRITVPAIRLWAAHTSASHDG